MKETFLPKSSNISQVEYDSDEQTLDVTFQDARTYRYRNVPQTVFLGLQNAQSAGSYFYRQIRSSYPATEV